MYNRGLVVGKFYPPHRGHKFLIDTALAHCRQLTIILCSRTAESIPGALRKEWLQTIHPTAALVHVIDDMPGDNDSAGWAKFTRELLGYIPDAVFTSEDYGHTYAKYLKTTHVLVDKERINVP